MADEIDALVDALIMSVSDTSDSGSYYHERAELLAAIDSMKVYAVSAKRMVLSDYVNVAKISAADMPHTVVEKLQAAIDNTLAAEGGR